MTDQIQPEYYTALDLEPIEVIEAWGLGFSLGNVVKYVARAGRKPGADALTDLRKASFYINREITRLLQAESGLRAPHGPDHDCPGCESTRRLTSHVSLAEMHRLRMTEAT